MKNEINCMAHTVRWYSCSEWHLVTFLLVVDVQSATCLPPTVCWMMNQKCFQDAENLFLLVWVIVLVGYWCYSQVVCIHVCWCYPDTLSSINWCLSEHQGDFTTPIFSVFSKRVARGFHRLHSPSSPSTQQPWATVTHVLDMTLLLNFVAY